MTENKNAGNGSGRFWLYLETLQSTATFLEIRSARSENALRYSGSAVICVYTRA